MGASGIPNVQKISARVVPGKRFPHQQHGPFLAGMVGHLKEQYAPPRMRPHHEDKQKSEGRRRHQEEIDGGHLVHVSGVADEVARSSGERSVGDEAQGSPLVGRHGFESWMRPANKRRRKESSS
jgi:hypothetical protein